MDLDDIDSAIIAQLQLDARQSNRELARRVGIAASTCLERVRGLHDRGVITGYHAQLDLAKIGRSVQAIVAAQIRPLSRTIINNFHDWATPRPEVLEVLVVAGGDN